MNTYLAYRAHQEEGRVVSRLETLEAAPLQAGQVRVAVHWSGINYKDALAATGAGRIMKRFPLTVGIDLAGVVAESSDPRFSPGAEVLVVGCGIGEESDGGFAQQAVVQGDWLVPLPAGLDLREAMAIGTAGFTAAMGIQRLEDNGLTPAAGSVLVNGASGGVGSLAVQMLAGLGYRVTAMSGKPAAADWLQELGAAEVVAAELPDKVRPLEKALWAGAIDNLGGAHLAWLCASTQPLGSIASIGLASSHELHTTVMPFILRGVNLLGINSTYCPPALRAKVWARLADDLKPRQLARTVQREVALQELPGVFDDYLQRGVTGRTLVRCI
ncbi:putative YhdH/YhfP family quinone oxidoreductase [Inhella inkyongensis]|uniref:Putative YhdH/YhfP family quinone oxidoreductase n=1 Tax=Inhella inkyongensis TaxID=392593 RepID=A0A840RWU4_9BURK|nr:acryloyl-CoA reductase [Inhella inkyongensis]MBB5203177.1 putative YhdH/YhfP family quinone oxidoreductase [Inhella inkyongensis]